MWVAIAFKVVALVLYKNGKTREEREYVDMKEQMEWEAGLLKVNGEFGYGYGYGSTSVYGSTGAYGSTAGYQTPGSRYAGSVGNHHGQFRPAPVMQAQAMSPRPSVSSQQGLPVQHRYSAPVSPYQQAQVMHTRSAPAGPYSGGNKWPSAWGAPRY